MLTPTGYTAADSHLRQTATIACEGTNGSYADVMVECNEDADDRESQSVKLGMKNGKGVNLRLQCYTRRESDARPSGAERAPW